jgi:hypothetical protein
MLSTVKGYRPDLGEPWNAIVVNRILRVQGRPSSVVTSRTSSR